MSQQKMEENILVLLADLEGVDKDVLYDKVKKNMSEDISEKDYYNLLGEICVSLTTTHYNYGKLGGRIIIYNLHRNITKSFSETIEYIQEKLNLFSEEFYNNVIEFRDIFDKSIDTNKDYDIDYFGFKTLEKSYLLKMNGEILETPQFMFMRVALAIHGKNIEEVISTYNDMSNKYYIHATPTLFNAGMKKQQLSSCYLIAMKEDSMEGIYDTLKECALISKWAGGIGVHIHQIRGKDSVIHSSNGKSDGIVPMLKVFNDTARYSNQNGKRAGSFAIYLEPWHNDIEAYLELKKNHGAEDERARDLFYALWIPDLFLKQVECNGDWYLMCPDDCRGLSDCFGDDFETLYWSYVKDEKYKKKINARDLWKQILISQIETGTPYMLYKDSANKKSNQKNLGTIKSSNLCVAPETLILTDKGHLEIKSLENQKVNIWNGEEFSEVIIKKTGENQELIDIETDDGCKLACTKYHKFYIQNDSILEKRAEELNIGDTLIDYSYPILDKSLDISSLLKTNNTLLKTKLDLQTLGIFSIVEENTLTITTKRPIKIKSIRDNNRRDDTYCFTEPKKHTGIFNGIITGQCSEIIEYSNAEETAVCNLASLGLPSFIDHDKKTFNHKLLGDKVRQLVRNLNRVIDINYYPTENCRRSNMRHRPIGIGVQGLADVFMDLQLDWESGEAKKLNKDIFETIYYYALLESNYISEERKWWIISHFDEMLETFEKSKSEFYSNNNNFIHKYEFERIKHRMYLNPSGINKLGAYSSYENSPISAGVFQFDLWDHSIKSPRYDWEGLKSKILTYGIRNSLLTTVMPTASTSQILGFTECIEPITSNIYSRRTMAGEFIVVNKRLMKNLIDLKLWNRELKDKIIENDGSIQDLDEIPSTLKKIYKTVWEIKQKTLIDMSAERGHFVCQSQSLNLFLNKIDMNRLGSMHIYAWKQGLKTGMYYLRTKTIAKTQKFTIEPKKDETCIMCSS